MKTPLTTVAIAAAACGLLAGCGQDEQVTTTSSTAVSTSTPQATASSAPAEVATTTTTATEPPVVETATPTGATVEPTRTATVTQSATTAPASPRTNAASTPQADTLPQKDPGDYGDAAVDAWTSGDLATVKKYVSPSATGALAGTPPTGELLRTACEADMCSYATEDGKRVTLTFDLDKVKAGRTGAITRVKVG